ncbi:hypothetical protein [Nostoc sp.]
MTIVWQLEAKGPNIRLETKREMAARIVADVYFETIHFTDT